MRPAGGQSSDEPARVDDDEPLDAARLAEERAERAVPRRSLLARDGRRGLGQPDELGVGMGEARAGGPTLVHERVDVVEAGGPCGLRAGPPGCGHPGELRQSPARRGCGRAAVCGRRPPAGRACPRAPGTCSEPRAPASPAVGRRAVPAPARTSPAASRSRAPRRTGNRRRLRQPSSSAAAGAPGRAPRPGAMTTMRPVSGSRRTSGGSGTGRLGVRRRGRGAGGPASVGCRPAAGTA